MKSSLIMLMVFISACSSTSEKKKNIDPAQSVSVKTADFKKNKPLSYNASEDYYQAPKGATQSNALYQESAGKSNNTELQQITNGKDQLASMMVLCYKKSFAEAFSIADQLFASHAKIPTYWNQVATCHLLQGNERKALLFYNKALEVTPKYVPALNNIGVIYNKNSQDQKAQVALQRAFEQGKFAKTPRFNLANLLLNYGLGEKALRLFKGLSDESPGDAEVRAGLATSYVFLSRWDEAWEQFNAIPDSKRKESRIGLNMALTAHQLGKSELAKDILGRTNVESSDKSYAASLRRIIGE
ncbi:MAG: tetratricopeptide repeat protein [Bacteriovoracaceae bacterium]|nr:tetratricopeptide repeat protein [Bacteriovoracaceae bacterium]